MLENEHIFQIVYFLYFNHEGKHLNCDKITKQLFECLKIC